MKICKNEFVKTSKFEFCGFVVSGNLLSLQASDSCVFECITGILSYVVVTYTKSTSVVDLCISFSDTGLFMRLIC